MGWGECSMEHVRLIITADEVIYPELTHNALASHFTGHLAVALKEAAEQAHQMEVLQEEMSDVSDGTAPGLPTLLLLSTQLIASCLSST